MAQTESIPAHLGLILDGNRRWAKAHGLPQLEGHRKGYENLKTITLEAVAQGVQYVSAYVFSTENWKRSKEEVDYLMKLLLWVARHEVKILDEHDIKVVFAGSRTQLSKEVIAAIEKAEARTAHNRKGTLVLCLNYGGQDEIIDAINEMFKEHANGEPVTKELFEQYLYAPDVPPVDLVIRTSGEHRISNFMLWRSAYAELLFSDVLWPEFSKQDLNEALHWYAKRSRRFGA